MADVVESGRETVLEAPPSRVRQRTPARVRSVRLDLWLATTALVSGMLALPLAQSAWHGPEVAAVLAVSATALFAGQRWAIALIVVAELCLLPTVWPRAFFGLDLIALVTLAAMVPGLLAMRRAATVLVMMAGWRRTPAIYRRVHVGLLVGGAIALLLPLAALLA